MTSVPPGSGRPGDCASTSLDGRRFQPVGAPSGGEVSAETTFAYHEADGLVWAEYEGGAISLGFLVGRRCGSRLEFRYCQLNQAGQTAGGVCVSTIRRLSDGRLRMEEHWRWESSAGEGVSAVEELLAVREPEGP